MRSMLLALALVAACGGTQSPAPLSNDAPSARRTVPSDPLALLPIDSELVGHVDVQRLRASATWRRFEPALLARFRTVGQFRDRCGVDLLAIRSMSIGLKQVGTASPSGVSIARGLDRDRSLACIERAQKSDADRLAPSVTIERGVVSGASPSGRFALAFSDATTAIVLAGSAAGPAEMDRLLAAGGVPLHGSPVFKQILTSVRVQDPLWFVLNGNARLLDEIVRMLGTRPRAVFGSVDLASGVAATLRARLASEDEAKQIAATLNGQIPAMARSFVERLDVTAEKMDFVVDLRMTDAQVDNLAQLAGSWIGSSGP